jgi:hypothetical protein
MSVSYATLTPSKMELSPMRVKYKKPGGSAIDLGGTSSGVTIETKFEKAEIKADQMGTSVLDRRVKGLIVTVTTELLEVQNMETIEVLFPHAIANGTSPNIALAFKSKIGESDLSVAGELTLHPLSLADATVTCDYVFYLACASAESSIVYTAENQAKMKIVWNILPDFTTLPAKFYRYGDPSL